MYVNVDADQGKRIEGYQYTNQDGEPERVTLKEKSVEILDSSEDTCSIYYTDIPNLILALQAAKAQHEEKQNG